MTRWSGRAALAIAIGIGTFGPSAAAAEPSRKEVAAALARATTFLSSIATEGGFLWTYSKDLSTRAGEKPATTTQIWIQPPGTPAVGMALLSAHQATGEAPHLEAARAAGAALARGQLASGGWGYMVDFAADARRAADVTVFDDDTTQSAVRFLLALADATRHARRPDPRDEPTRKALARALDGMVRAQYPNGAWPQRYAGAPVDPADRPILRARIPKDWPRTWPRQDYAAHYTLNDDSQRTCIATMLDAHRRTGKRAYLDAARRAGDFLISAQLPAPQAGWAQQYDARMEPAWARAFEPPAVSSRESVGAIHALLDLSRATGDARYLAPIPAAITWLEASRIAPDTWARLYELGTNRPIYGDRDGKVRHDLAEVSEERRKGYAWQGGFGVAAAIRAYRAVAAAPRAVQRTGGEPPPVSAARIAEILAAQDAQGRWLDGDTLKMRTFVTNIEALASYLRQKRPGTGR